MGAQNNGDGQKYTYYNLKTKTAKFEQYVKGSDPVSWDSMANILLEKVGRRKKQINNGPVFWEYCLLFSDLDDDGAKIIITVPNFGNVLIKVFGPLLSLDSIEALDFSPYIKNNYFKLAIRKHGQKPMIPYPFTWNGDKKWFDGVPNVVWTKEVKDGIESNVSDDTNLKEFIVEKLKEWCPKALGTPFYEADLNERIFSGDSPSTSSESPIEEGSVQEFIKNLLEHYKTFESLRENWSKVVKNVAKKFQDEDFDFFYNKIPYEIKSKYGIVDALICNKTTLEIVSDDLPF